MMGEFANEKKLINAKGKGIVKENKKLFGREKSWRGSFTGLGQLRSARGTVPHHGLPGSALRDGRLGGKCEAAAPCTRVGVFSTFGVEFDFYNYFVFTLLARLFN